jgi:hypothetical protein
MNERRFSNIDRVVAIDVYPQTLTSRLDLVLSELFFPATLVFITLPVYKTK